MAEKEARTQLTKHLWYSGHPGIVNVLVIDTLVTAINFPTGCLTGVLREALISNLANATLFANLLLEPPPANCYTSDEVLVGRLTQALVQQGSLPVITYEERAAIAVNPPTQWADNH